MKKSSAVPSVRSQRAPARWNKEIERMLISDKQLARRIKELSVEIERDFKGHEMVVVSLLNGTVMFLADLIRYLSLPLRLDFMGVSSYALGTESGELVFTKELHLDGRGPYVVLGDDILDTGKTLSNVVPKPPPVPPGRLKAGVLLGE